MSTAHDHNHPSEGFHYGRFFTLISIEIAIVFTIYRFVAPGTFFAEFANPGKVVLWAFLFGLPMSLFEYLYHRYLLHAACLPFMAAMHRAHTTHHALTAVKAPVTPQEPEKLVDVKTEYAVEYESQEESMMFPIWSLAIFLAVFLVIMALPFKLMFPGEPIVAGVLISVILCYCAYEIWHAILHLPFEVMWEPLMRRKAIRPMMRRIYSFHLMHHWRPTSNLAVVGFWGFAIWDYVFRTHRRPYHLPIKGAKVNYNDARLPKPLWPISALDRAQGPLIRGSRKIERFLAKIFLPKRSTSS